MSEQRIYSVKYVELLEAVYEAAKVVAHEVIPHKPIGDLSIINLRKTIAAVEAQDNLKKD